MNLSPNRNFISPINLTEKGFIPLNCLKNEMNLFKCNNQSCSSYFCKTCLENSNSNICIKCKSGNLISEDCSQFKCTIILI